MITIKPTGAVKFPKADCNMCAWQENVRHGFKRCPKKCIDCDSHDPETPCSHFADVRE